MKIEKEEFTDTEHEIIVLYAVWRMIDEMVNYGMFVKFNKTKDTNLLFETAAHKRLFNILLSDFLSAPSKHRNSKSMPFGLHKIPAGMQLSASSFLFYLENVTNNPLFGGDILPLRRVVQEFKLWLDEECTVDGVWLSSINVEVDLRAPRFQLLKICGNIGKHNFSRLEVNVLEIKEILSRNGKVIDVQQAYMALDDFYEWFHDHFFAYHSSTIAEFLNNIRWAIFRYLQKQYARSYIPPKSGDPRYSYSYPPDCNQPIARGMFWDLMNSVRSKPDFPEFSVSSSSKSLY